MIFLASRSALRFAVSRISRIWIRGVGVRFLLHPVDELSLRVGGRYPGELLQAPALLAKELVEFLLALGESELARADGVGAARSIALALLQHFVLAVEKAFPIGNSALFLLDLFAPASDLDFPLLTKSNQLFFSSEHGGLARAFSVALCIADYSFGCFFGRGVGLLLPAELGAPSDPSADKKKNRAGKYEQKYAGCG